VQPVELGHANAHSPICGLCLFKNPHSKKYRSLRCISVNFGGRRNTGTLSKQDSAATGRAGRPSIETDVECQRLCGFFVASSPVLMVRSQLFLSSGCDDARFGSFAIGMGQRQVQPCPLHPDRDRLQRRSAMAQGTTTDLSAVAKFLETVRRRTVASIFLKGWRTWVIPLPSCWRAIQQTAPRCQHRPRRLHHKHMHSESCFPKSKILLPPTPV
jgi:hypothetical protein